MGLKGSHFITGLLTLTHIDSGFITLCLAFAVTALLPLSLNSMPTYVTQYFFLLVSLKTIMMSHYLVSKLEFNQLMLKIHTKIRFANISFHSHLPLFQSICSLVFQHNYLDCLRAVISLQLWRSPQPPLNLSSFLIMKFTIFLHDCRDNSLKQRKLSRNLAVYFSPKSNRKQSHIFCFPKDYEMLQYRYVYLSTMSTVSFRNLNSATNKLDGFNLFHTL